MTSITSLLGGGYLLSHFRSTIGVVRLNFSVRNGKRWDPHAMTTLLSFGPDGAYRMGRGRDGLKRPSGERATEENTSSDFISTTSGPRGHNCMPVMLFIAHRTHTFAKRCPSRNIEDQERANSAPGKLSGD